MKKLRSPPSHTVAHLKELCDYQVELVGQLNDKINEAEEISKELTKLRTLLIPAVANEVGLSEFKTTSGFKASIIKEIRASISEEKKEAALDYMSKNGAGSLIKSEVKVKFDDLDNEKAASVIDFLKSQEVVYDRNRSVHYQTLQSYVKKLLAEGVKFDQSLFNVFQTEACKIDKLKIPKLKK